MHCLTYGYRRVIPFFFQRVQKTLQKTIGLKNITTIIVKHDSVSMTLEEF